MSLNVGIGGVCLILQGTRNGSHEKTVIEESELMSESREYAFRVTKFFVVAREEEAASENTVLVGEFSNSPRDSGLAEPRHSIQPEDALGIGVVIEHPPFDIGEDFLACTGEARYRTTLAPSVPFGLLGSR